MDQLIISRKKAELQTFIIGHDLEAPIEYLLQHLKEPDIHVRREYSVLMQPAPCKEKKLLLAIKSLAPNKRRGEISRALYINYVAVRIS